MKRLTKLSVRLQGLTNAITRYPFTAAFLLAASVLASVSINTENDYSKQFMTCVIGAVLCAVLQASHERFFYKMSTRLILMVGGVLLSSLYYLIIKVIPEFSVESRIRTSVTIFALIFAFIWVPVIRSRISFNESFMSVFKSLSQSVFYSAVIFIGCSLIIGAIDLLIFNISEKAYPHTANIVFVLFAPIFFLSLIPIYPGKYNKETDPEKTSAQREAVANATFCPKFLEILISYIIIPLVEIFTIILLLYIFLNIRGEFWTNNLLEPMLVAYAITVILVYILSSNLENKFAIMFRLIFPKVLIPIVLFQIISSSISIRDTGITYSRYFVILFGLFAVCAGVAMSIVHVRKNGIIAAMLIAFSAISIIPPIDAFTISRISQENLLKTILLQNAMLENNAITPNSSISKEDKEKIILSAEYLGTMKYTDEISWMPKDFNVYEDFYETFGFYRYDLPDKLNRFINVFINSSNPLDISGYDILTHAYIYSDEKSKSEICTFKKLGKIYVLTKEYSGDNYDVVLLNDSNGELIRFSTSEILSRYSSYSTDKSEISNEEATFTAENDEVKLSFVVQNASINVSPNQMYCNADLYILVKLK